MTHNISTAPDGTKYKLPTPQDYKKEFARIEKLVSRAKKNNQEIIVVMGVGFVGAVMAAIVADTEAKPQSTKGPSPIAYSYLSINRTRQTQ
jgi:hypothetical protein